VIARRQGGERFFAGIAGRALPQFRGDLPLRVRELSRLELRLAERPTFFIGTAGLHLPLELTKLIGGLRPIRGRLLRVLTPQVVRRAAHRRRSIPHLLALRTLRTLRTLHLATLEPRRTL
jgi:hypothetical protein